MGERWGFNRFRLRIALLMMVCLLNLDLCWSLNTEGLALLRFREKVVSDPFGALSDWNDYDGLNDPCSWFGVECSEGKVVILNLIDLCLGGTLAPELGNLIHIKSIILRNNSFHGVIPKDIGELKELEVLDLGYNNFSGPVPSDLGNNLSLAILLLDNNRFLGSISPELQEFIRLSELQVDENQLTNAAQGTSSNKRSISWNFAQVVDVSDRRQLKDVNGSNSSKSKSNKINIPALNSTPSASPLSSPLPAPDSSPSQSPSSSPSASSPNIFLTPASSPATTTTDLTSPTPLYQPTVAPESPPSHSSPVPSTSASPTQSPSASSTPTSFHSKHKVLMWSGIVGASSFLFISVIVFLFCRSNKVVTVKPWSTGLSGQLQKAFVTGVPKLNRSELETACEDFSNIIGSSSDGTVYKGTLSSGVEIAVVSTAVTSAKDWSKNFEGHFRKKIDTLSKVNHKNFVNLLGYCEDEEPFTRMMVFEYAPNGTLFEHLHIKEAEHLNWGARLRIMMGMVYCLDHMHQLNPPVIHTNLHSSVVYLTEDYAAKIIDFCFCNEVAAANEGSAGMEFLDISLSDAESNVYSFGVILLEMITGRLPYSVDNVPLVNWASGYMRGEQPFKDMVDPTLKSFDEVELGKLCDVIRSCIHPDPMQRPMMREVASRLRDITAMGPDGATPRLSPLWWAELEIMSTEAS